MRHAIFAAALLAAVSPAFAQQTQTTPAPSSAPAPAAARADGTYYTGTERSDFYASKLIGARVYSTTAQIDIAKPVDRVGADWKDIGEVNNIIVGKDGAVKAVILGVGGFLGLGEKDVAVSMSTLHFLKKAGASADDWFVVANLDKASLEQAPAYKMP